MGALGVIFAASLLAACEPDVQIHAEVQPAPSAAPAPAKCESLDEHCLAKGDTAARLSGVPWVLTPPSGWTYAQQTDQTIAEKTADKQAVMVVATFEAPKLSWELKKIQLEMIDKLTKKVGVAPRNRDVFSVHGETDELKVGALDLHYYEQPDCKRSDKSGPMLVVVGGIEKKQLMVVSFAPKGDLDDSQAIMQAVQSLKPKGNL